ncbi:MAG: LPS export ABC transporter periplasmic protein LptC [Pseudomonadota bacterium]|nr:LPS export ABC transporter periplasmic protein LptC [Pseudomonadota bacterium]
MKWSRGFLPIAFGVIFVECLIIAPQPLGRRPKKSGAIAVSVTQTVKADQVLESVKLIGTEGGRREWELNAETAVDFKGKGEWQLEKIKTIFFGKVGTHYSVKGKSGQVNIETRDMMISGDVVTKTSNNFELKSDIVYYDSKNKLLKSESPVSILGPKDKKGNRLRLEGIGMNALVQEGKTTILENVKGEVALEDGTIMNVKSKSVELRADSRWAQFYGNVVIDVGSMRVSGPGAQFQYEADSGSLSSLFVNGGVKVSDVGKLATSENVKVLFKDNKFVFRGNPRLLQDQDELLGEEIVFLQGGKRVQIKGARANIESKKLEKVK